MNPVLVGVCMSQEDTENEKWFDLEKQLVLSTCNGGSLPLNFRPSLHCFTDSTDNKFNPIGFVGGLCNWKFFSFFFSQSANIHHNLFLIYY